MGGRGASFGGGGGSPSYVSLNSAVEFKDTYYRDAQLGAFRKKYTLEQAYKMAKEEALKYHTGKKITDINLERALAILGREYNKGIKEKEQAEYNDLRNEYLSLIKGKKGAKWEREKVNLMPTSAAYFRREIAKIKGQRGK